MDYLKLKSGRKLYINCGFVSINENLDIAEGYDSELPRAPNDPDYEYDDKRLTKEEAIELANIMINRWTEFKKSCE